MAWWRKFIKKQYYRIYGKEVNEKEVRERQDHEAELSIVKSDRRIKEALLVPVKKGKKKYKLLFLRTKEGIMRFNLSRLDDPITFSQDEATFVPAIIKPKF